MTSTYARPFRITLPDGRHLDGVEFPSGRVVVDDAHAGLFNAAASIDHLLGSGDRVEWALSIDRIREVRDIQGWHGTWNFSPYMRGLYNGMELALSIAEGERKPEFREDPDQYLCDLPAVAVVGEPVPESEMNS